MLKYLEHVTRRSLFFLNASCLLMYCIVIASAYSYYLMLQRAFCNPTRYSMIEYLHNQY